MPAKLIEFARRLIAIVAIYKFEKPIRRPNRSSRDAANGNSSETLACERYFCWLSVDQVRDTSSAVQGKTLAHGIPRQVALSRRQ